MSTTEETAPTAPAQGQSFIIVEGGIVQNDPSLPVFDLDVLDQDSYDERAVDEVLDFHRRLSEHAEARAAWPSALERAVAIVSDYGTHEQLLVLRGQELPGVAFPASQDGGQG